MNSNNQSMNLSPEIAAQYGVPVDIAPWRFELILAYSDPAGYRKVLSAAAPQDLICSYERMTNVLRMAADDIERFVPFELADQFILEVAELREIALVEAAKRGISLHLPTLVHGRPVAN